MSGKFQLKKASNGQFHFNLLAGNGQVVLSSEQYQAHASALNGIDSVRKNAV
ncbi:YegP family protein, partial [Stutzerimonas nitrititolerans]